MRPYWLTIAEAQPGRSAIEPRRPGCVLLVLFLLVAACSPELNWRELRSEPGGFTAVLPGKLRLDEREIAGEPGVVLHLWSSEASNAVFGIGYADYPDAGRLSLERMRDALVANIKGTIVSDREIELGAARGREFHAHGPSAVLAARVLASGSRFYQVAVVSRAGNLAPPDVDLFLDSFRLLSTK